ncbi:MAG: DVU_1553 family AMP-dependent CoA ligase [Syntrophaceae bacterium]
MADSPFKLTPLHSWIDHKIGSSSETFTREAIMAYQLRKVRETLHLAKEKSIFYRSRLVAFPPDIASLEELKHYPFTTAEDIRREPLQFLCVSQSEIQRVVSLDSSGTTGLPKRLFFTRDDQELTIDFFHVGMSTFTVPGDRVLILLPVERPGSVGDLLAIALERMGAIGIRHGLVRDVGHTLAVIAKEDVNGIVGVPTQVLALARNAGMEKSDRLRLKSVLLTMDHVPDAIVRAVESSWGCTVYNHYGMTEMGLGGGVECQAHHGYHMREADLYVEIIDPVDGKTVLEGEYGEVVFTTLTRRGMPLLRYRTGDISRFVPGDCPCGTILRTLEKVHGRIGNSVDLGNGHCLTMADLDDALFPIDGVWNFTASLSREGTMDHLRVEVWGTGETTGHVVQQAVEAIPEVREARDPGRLEVVAMMRKEGPVGFSGQAKRMLVDRRLPSG